MRGRADFHRLLGDVEIGQLHELVIHRGQLLLDVFRRVRNFFLDPGNVEKHAAVRAAASGLDLAVDAAGHVVARQQFRRTLGVLVALRVAPAFLGIGRGLRFVIVRNVVVHEALAVLVAQHAAFAAHAFGHENAHDARRPDHAGRMKLDELHVEQFRARVIRQRNAVAGAFPGIAGDLDTRGPTRRWHSTTAFALKIRKRPRSRS